MFCGTNIGCIWLTIWGQFMLGYRLFTEGVLWEGSIRGVFRPDVPVVSTPFCTYLYWV